MDQAISSIAHGMGIERLGPGRHILRDENRWRIGELDVLQAWHALVLPSFHDRAVVAVVRAQATEFRGKTSPGFLRAGIAIVGLDNPAIKQTIVVDIDHDPLPSCLESLGLFSCNKSLWIDGIGYELSTETNVCRSTFRFSNPIVPCFRRIEDALLEVASRIGTLSGDAAVVEYVNMWQFYLNDSGRAVPPSR